MKKRIAVFASGGGTDFQSVIDANEKEGFCEICLLIASKDGIGAIDRAKKHGIQTEVFSKNDYRDSEELYSALSYLLNMHRVDYVVLAGWLKIIPASFIATFRDRIINIHPSLIPSFCGAGFYGMKVHSAVIEYGAKGSGCTLRGRGARRRRYYRAARGRCFGRRYGGKSATENFEGRTHPFAVLR